MQKFLLIILYVSLKLWELNIYEMIEKSSLPIYI